MQSVLSLAVAGQAGKIRRSKRILSKQRGDPIAPQGQVVMPCLVGASLIRRTNDPTKSVAPQSDDPMVDRVHRGDWAFFTPSSLDTRPTRATNNTPTISVSTNVNGFPKDEPFAFAGVITFQGQGKGVNETTDNAATLVLQGTATGRNTGPETIHVGSQVFLNEYPYLTQDASGKVIPAIEDPGWASNFAPPATHSFSSANVLVLVNKLQKCVYQIFRTKTPATHRALVEELKLVAKENELVGDCPLQLYPLMFAAHLISCSKTQTQYRLADVEQRIFLAYSLNEYNKYLERTHKKYDNSLHVHNRNELKKTFSHDSTLEYLQAEAFVLTNDAMASLVAKFQEYFAKRFVGTALNTAPTGQPLDVLLRTSR